MRKKKKKAVRILLTIMVCGIIITVGSSYVQPIYIYYIIRPMDCECWPESLFGRLSSGNKTLTSDDFFNIIFLPLSLLYIYIVFKVS